MTGPTEAARRNLASGATSGAGTSVCIKCKGRKEDRRLNSGKCAACNNPGAVTGHKVSVVLSVDVFGALSAEATRNGQTPEERVAFLLTKKYTR